MARWHFQKSKATSSGDIIQRGLDVPAIFVERGWKWSRPPMQSERYFVVSFHFVPSDFNGQIVD